MISDNRNKLEVEFEQLTTWIKTKNPGCQIQQIISNYSEEEIPEEYRRAFRFFNSIDGSSKELLWRVTFNKKCKKQFIKTKTHLGWKPLIR